MVMIFTNVYNWNFNTFLGIQLKMLTFIKIELLVSLHEGFNLFPSTKK